MILTLIILLIIVSVCLIVATRRGLTLQRELEKAKLQVKLYEDTWRDLTEAVAKANPGKSNEYLAS